MDELEIIKRAKYDVSAFDMLYEEYFLQIYKFVLLRVKDRDITNEIVSDVFYKAMSKISLFKWRSIPFSSWLYRIAINEISNYFRREKKQYKLSNKLSIEEAHYTPPIDFDDSMSYEFIINYIKKLPQRDQDIIILRYFEKKKFEEIAEIIGKNEGYIRVILHRALKKLKQLLPKEVLENVDRKVS